MLNNIRKRIDSFRVNLKYAFRINKPMLILRLMCNFLSIIFLNKRLLRYVDFAIGYKCNLHCEHCFATSLIEKGREAVTPMQYARIAREAMRMGALNFSFQGGEPLLYPELKEHIRAVGPWRNLISVTTNGTLLTDEKLMELKRWGVDILTISLDSGIPEEHDSFRGMEGSFLKIYEGIKRALLHRINVTIGAVVTHQNLKSEGIKKLIEISSDLKVILMLILAVPVGRWKDKEDVLLGKDDLGYLEGLVSENLYVRYDFYANYFKRGCGAVKEIFYLNPYGDVFACPFIHKKLGNALTEPLADIRERALKDENFKYYHQTCVATLKEVYGG
ncbi:MAG: radical SAM/SPASM domain-containing protein [Candidatus Omnitrophota bacterium]